MTEASSIFGITVPVVSYSSTVFPILVGVFILSLVEKGCNKVIPKSFSGLFTPLICIVVTAPIMLIVVGPAVNMLSDALGNAIIGLYNATGAIGGAVFGSDLSVPGIYGSASCSGTGGITESCSQRLRSASGALRSS